MRRLILFLIRRKLGLKKYQKFQFAGQKDKNSFYYICDDAIYKETYKDGGYSIGKYSDVSVNWILSDECKNEIIKVETDGYRITRLSGRGDK